MASVSTTLYVDQSRGSVLLQTATAEVVLIFSQISTGDETPNKNKVFFENSAGDVTILWLVEKYTIASMAWIFTLKKKKEIKKTE